MSSLMSQRLLIPGLKRGPMEEPFMVGYILCSAGSWAVLSICAHAVNGSGTLGSTGFMTCTTRLVCKVSLVGAGGYDEGQSSLMRWKAGLSCSELTWQDALLSELLNIDQFLNRVLIYLQWRVRRQWWEETEKSGFCESSIPNKKIQGMWNCKNYVALVINNIVGSHWPGHWDLRLYGRCPCVLVFWKGQDHMCFTI